MMIPDHVRAIFDALAFDRRAADLSRLTAGDLAFADRSHLTLLLSRAKLNAESRAYVDAALARNTARVKKIATDYAEIADSFDHVVLKGFTHVPAFIDDLRLRVQYDLDLYAPPSESEKAREALIALGYRAIEGQESLAMDHLPAMVRKTGWQWRGDYFDPEIPTSVEVHFRFWDPETERLRAEGVDDFWARREGNQLSLPDKLGYAALHLTRHLLRGNVRAFHVWELANFLDSHPAPEFWREWQRTHSRLARRLEAVAFLLAKTWFAPRVPDLVQDAIDQLPARVHRWFEIYGWSPAETILKPNKDELWLHLSLLDSAFDQFEVFRRRVIPVSAPGPVDAIYTPESELTLARRLERAFRNLAYAGSRAIYHLRLLLPTVWEGLRWRLRSR
jgi:Uncharacterised nucleotidyltransferase